ncbi:MAG: hydrogenase maturation protease [Acidobacteriia bacterium]|nr:hydrogenase maturation protease [Terriglobia bacterium]
MSKTVTQRETPGGAGGRGMPMRVVGCGNAWAGDDSAGLEIVRRLEERGGCPCELLERPQAGVELMEVLRGVETVLFLDAVSSGAPAGTLHLVPLPSAVIVPRTLGAISSHGWGLAETLRLMAALRHRIPRLGLLGVEIEAALPGTPRSAPVESAIQVVVERFAAFEEFLAPEGQWDWVTPRRFAPGEALCSLAKGEAPTDKGGF